MSMSCLRIRSSSKSRGPSYTSLTETANGESLSSFLFSPEGCGSDFLMAAPPGTRLGISDGSDGSGICGAPFPDVTILSSILLSIFPHRRFIRERHSHGIAYPVHGRNRNFARTLTASLKNIPCQPRILLEFLAPLLHRTQQLHQRIRRPALALNAPNARRAAAGVHFRHRGAVAEDLVQIAHRTHIRIPRIRPPHSRRVRDHRLQFLPHHRLRISQQDGVAIRLRHLAAVRARQLRRPRQQDLWLRKDISTLSVIAVETPHNLPR